MSAPDRPHVGFVFERILGHDTHAKNLTELLQREPSIDPEFVDVNWDVRGAAARVPVFRTNWTVRSGIRARRGIRKMSRARPLQSLFVHTQVPAVLAPDWLARIPTVVSVDATPLQYDELGEHYDHHPRNRHVERLTWHANRLCFARARHIVAWSAWAKRGLVDGYGVDPAKVTVIPPGVNPADWVERSTRVGGQGPVRILFVGGDLERKGGDVLLRAYADVRADPSPTAPDVELHLVTRTKLSPPPGVVVHNDLGPVSPALVELYSTADVFCLPTRGDCLPMVLSEAGAAGLPLVSTAVAGIPEIVLDGETGLVVPVDDRTALTEALRRLVHVPELRRRLGAGARTLIEREFNAEINCRRLVELLLDVAVPDGGRS